MLVITPCETFELDADQPRLNADDLREARRRAAVTLRLASIEAWEQMQSPLAGNRVHA